MFKSKKVVGHDVDNNKESAEQTTNITKDESMLGETVIKEEI